MSQKANKIKFITVNTSGGGNDGNDLKNCYFLPTNQTGKYVFFDNTGLPLVTTPMPVVAGSPFTFVLNSFNWTIPNPAANSQAFVISGTGATATASGSWSNDDDGTATASVGYHPTPSLGDDGTGESGTFQAQAGQQVDPEDPEGEDAARAAKA
jgi:hypothetical protein